MVKLETRRAAVVRILVIDCAVLVAVLVVGALAKTAAWTAADDALVHTVNAAHTPFLDHLALALNIGFGPSMAGIVAVVVACVVGLWRRSVLTGVYTLALTGAPWVCAEVVKLIVRRMRPDPSLLSHPLVPEPATFSYPSGHTAFAFALVLAIVATLPRGKVAIGWLVAVVVGGVTAWSRIYVGAHFTTDVCASLVLVPAFMSITRVVIFWVMPRPVIDRLHDRTWVAPRALPEREAVRL